ncbi:MAG: topA [Sphingobacterium sp.]|jgi:DNA topoisomerase-1|uniref:type I DNA topoisomerase n=1 Tax=unclassified Sphingobacterium TaxID=2609468 RepID=UPI00098787C2|nr:type I DNA topoisomerase [Sphingobacterium sp. CZ-UAM]MDF2519168.1 topA [Sphingobacterium sp.]OOG19605.1 DNA topoisomerase I [Sphingobacterium sp. CZ-UAM]
MAKNLLIVESPAKAKTIEGYLGSDFLVKSSYGHIRDLVKTDDAINTANNFEQKYEVPSDKKAVVSELKKLAKAAETVWLASDEDREGEAISWHLFETLGLKDASTKRIVFHEITKPAILKAIENPRKIDYNLVNAQQARRVLDRLVGFELSPVLWKKVKPSLSAGRVQSVAVRLIVDREREINKFEPEAAFKIVAFFHTGKIKDSFKAELPQRFATEAEATQFLEDCKAALFTVKNLETKPSKRSPAAPFTTSTLQQEASRKLGFSVARTMQVAQRLYESGRITYMRTDSVNLSDTAIEAAEKEIKSAYGNKYHKVRRYKTKTSGAQEAHEAIRPTYFSEHTIEGDSAEKRLYELIWKRAIASQMSEAEFERTLAKISISTRTEDLNASGEVMKFDGFLKVYMESVDDDQETTFDEDSDNAILPPLTVGLQLVLKSMSATERFTRPPARYTEAALVKKLEELGIGRPSTYAPTISTIQNRGYVVKEEREGKSRNYRVLTLEHAELKAITKTEITGAEKGKMFPTDIGIVVNDFLVEHFNGIVDFHFTANVEKEFDDIAHGLTEWTKMLHDFYGPFHSEVEDTLENADRANNERELGVDPVSGKPVSVRIGKFGPLVQIGSPDDEEKPRFASLRKGQMIETITFDDAMELFKLPKKVGVFEDKEMTVAVGRFGPYIRHNSAFYSLPKGVDPLDVTEEECIQIIQEKRQKDIEKVIRVFDENPDAQIEQGRWGPFIRFGKQNLKIPKGTEIEKISYADVLKWAEADAPKGKAVKAKTAEKKTVAKKTTAKKATTKKTTKSK